MDLELYNMTDMELETFIKKATEEIRRRKMDYYNQIIEDAKRALEKVSTSGIPIYVNGEEVLGGYQEISFELPEITH